MYNGAVSRLPRFASFSTAARRPVRRSNLGSVVLQLKKLGIDDLVSRLACISVVWRYAILVALLSWLAE
jgi:hypothetical protein